MRLRYRHLYFRFFLCACLGLIPLSGLERRSYDWLIRFQNLRPHQTPMALIQFERLDLVDAHNRLAKNQPHFRETSWRTSDYPAWDDFVYSHLFTRLKKADPKLIVMTYPFPSTIDEFRTRMTADAVHDAPMVWASRLQQEGDVDYPPSPLTPTNNYGFGNFNPDTDGILRHVNLFQSGHVHLALRILRELKLAVPQIAIEEPQLISFKSDIESIPQLSLAQILFQPIDSWERWVNGKVVFIGVGSGTQTPLFTPRGELSRSEMHAITVANLIDDATHGDGFLQKAPWYLQYILIYAMIALAALITLRVSVTYAGFLILFQGAICLAFSAFVFNTFNMWIYVASPLLSIIGTYSLLIHYQLMTKEKARERALGETENLRKLDEMKNNYMSMFSHDLKTPIAKIDAICDRLLVGSEAQTVYAEDMRSILKANEELKNYIFRILQLTRVESGHLVLEKSVCDINRVIEEVVERSRKWAKEKGVSLELKLEPLYTMELDENLLRDMVQNLIDNAITYCPQGTKVEIESAEVDAEVVISVRDNGPGIPKEEVRFVTDKFYRGSHGKRVERGSGLGLYLVKYFTRIHGGRFHVTSELGRGTTAHIHLPMDESSDKSKSV